MSLGLGSSFHQTGFTQNPKVLRDGRLGYFQLIDQISDRTFLDEEQLEDSPPIRLSQCVEGRCHLRRI